jgi:hypothetical protein
MKSVYKRAVYNLEGFILVEKSAIEKVNMLSGTREVINTINDRKEKLDNLLQIQLNTLHDLMTVRAKELSIDAATLNPDDAEESAIKIIPVPTEKAKTMKYAGYNEYIRKLSSDILSSSPYVGIVNTNEAAGLADGRRNLLQIKKMVDAQFEKESPLDKIINYYNVLKEAGLMKF